MGNQPDIVMIMADQFAANVIRAHGHPAVRTPNLDRLIGSGVTFSNSYCNSPLCVPSRASMMTGMHVDNIEVYDNGSELRASVPTFVHHLRRSGYYTVLAGKMHFIGPDQLHGFEERIAKDIHTAGFELTPDWSRGAYANAGTGVKRLREPGPCGWNSQLHHDEKTLACTLEKIRELGWRGRREQFFLCTSFTHPHDPFVIVEEYWDRVKDLDVPMPAAPADPLDDMHPYNQWIQVHHEVDQCRLSEEQIRDNRRAYYAMVHYIDDKVGLILGELERMGLADNTMIVFTSDHGEMLGEHGMWFKRTFFDSATKVPLVISWPGRLPAGKRIDQVVSLVDLGPSLMEWAGVPDAGEWIAGMDGDSFAGLVEGRTPASSWKDEAACLYCGEGPIRPMAALRQGRFKYVSVLDHEPLLFDLEEDPRELRSRTGDPLLAEVERRMEAAVSGRYDLAVLDAVVRRSQRERLMMAEALQAGVRTRWEHKPV